MTTLLICRHGRTDWNDQGRYQGKADIPLNPHGWEEAESLADALSDRHLDAVYASSLSRASDTAARVARRHRLEVTRDPRFNEIDQGLWEGMHVSAIAHQFPELHRRWIESPLEVSPPEGESLSQVRDRALDGLNDAVRRYPNGTICLVTHRVVLVTLLWALKGIDPSTMAGNVPPTGALIEMDVNPARFQAPQVRREGLGSVATRGTD